MMKRLLKNSVAVLLLFPLSVAWAAEETMAQDEPATVQVIFQNNHSSSVNVYLVDDSKEDSQEPELELFLPDLPSNEQAIQKAASGVTFQFQEASGDGKVLAEYVTDDRPFQPVPIAELIDWQSPVELIFQNTTGEPLDFYWLQADGQETLIGEQLPPQREFSTPSMPGSSWIIKRQAKQETSEGAFVAEFMAGNIKQQVIDVAALATWFQPKTVAFENLTNSPLDLYWVNDDGDEILFTKTDNDKPLPLPSEKRMVVTAQPLSVWRIRQHANGKLIAEYSVENDPRQIVALSNEPPSAE